MRVGVIALLRIALAAAAVDIIVVCVCVCVWIRKGIGEKEPAPQFDVLSTQKIIIYLARFLIPASEDVCIFIGTI